MEIELGLGYGMIDELRTALKVVWFYLGIRLSGNCTISHGIGYI